MATAPKFLLTGCEGQVGFELHRTLSSLGEVTAMARSQLDLSNQEQIRITMATLRPDVVVNAAAYTAVDRAESELELATHINVDAPRVLAEEAAKYGGGIVHFSTDYVFDGESHAPYLENDPTNPLSVYGATKLAGEQAVLAANGAALVFRTSWVYGTRGRNFLLTIRRLAAERDRLTIVADQLGAPTWSRNIAGAVAQALTGTDVVGQMRRNAGVYHLTAAGYTSWYEFSQEILRRDDITTVTVSPIQTADYPTPATRPRYSVLDNNKIIETLGIRMPTWDLALKLAMDNG